ncbi:hypothetical protein PHJA_001764200 [Phtheirospermum japonicum]|uniref:S-protein homolog n=1 Tax=Phtheirospermum japonicum TaxID=374723 RepID=A0A830CPD8_9LAMI|nr:hypothetical protein PHJA_001764200 [Phtheirospermum japonicum]
MVFLLLSASLHARGVSDETPTNNTSGRKFSLWPKTIVRVYNNLGNDINLTLHCKSRDNDLGIQLLANGDSFQWKFHPNIFGTTTFYCSMEWNDKSGSFDLYVDQRDSERCIVCVWKVTQNGVRGYSKEDGVEQIWFRWAPKPPSFDSYYITP